MWFKDLSPYRYTLITAGWPPEGPPEDRKELFHWMVGDGVDAFEDPEVNVGWLDLRYKFPVGPSAPDAVEILARLCRDSRYMLERGFHPCVFCDKGPGVVMGNAEIRVQGDGVVYASPTLVAHYVSQHQYLPPLGFMDAVQRSNGQQAVPVPGKRRGVPPELLVPSDIDLDRLCGRVRAYVGERFGDAIREVSISHLKRGVVVSVQWEFWPGGIYAVRRCVPPDAILDDEQAFRGITSMIESAYGSEEASRIFNARPALKK